MGYLLSVDCGLTVSKAAVFDLTGKKIAESRRNTPQSGVYIDSEALWRCTAACIREVLEANEFSLDILAVGLSGHGNGLYALDEYGAPVATMSSMFDFNQSYVNAFRESASYAAFRKTTHQSVWSGQPMQILKWLKLERPECYDRIRCVLMCKDFLRYKLTGVLATDDSDFTASALAMQADGVQLCEMLGISEMAQAFPQPLCCDQISGCVSMCAARETGLREGTPVAVGGIDLFCCMQGAGIVDSGMCSITAGTWGVTAAYADDVVNLEALTQQCIFRRGFKQVAVVSAPTSCVNLDWFLEKIRPGLSYSEADQIVAQFAPTSIQAIYLPYLYRDMAHPEIDAGFRALSPTDGWKELLRAVYEGVCLAHRLQFDRLRRAGVRMDCVRMSGGITNSSVWCQMMSDILQIEIGIPAERQAGLLGAAMMAAVSIHVYSSLDEAGQKMSAIDRVYVPNTEAVYNDKYYRFLSMVGETT